MRRKTKKPLSPRAATLWRRVQNDSNWYPALAGKTTPAMQELIDAGLVRMGGRVVKMAAYFVPKGTKPFKLEQFPKVRP